MSASSGLLDAAGGVGRDQTVVYGLVERHREDTLHAADGVGVQTLPHLSGLKCTDVHCREIPKAPLAEEGHQVDTTNPLVAL